MADLRQTERRILSLSRFLTLVAVVSSFAGAVLMFWLGLVNTWRAFAIQITATEVMLPADDLAVIHLIGALDRFLIAIVLLFFGYGVYVLFIRPEATPPQLGLPEWLHVESIGQLKQTLAEVIIVVLFVLFLRVAIETFVTGPREFDWQQVLGFLVLPVSIALLSAALRLAQLHPKTRPPSGDVNPGSASAVRSTPGQDE